MGLTEPPKSEGAGFAGAGSGHERHAGRGRDAAAARAAAVGPPRLRGLAEGRAVPLRAVSYQRLHAIATVAASEHEKQTLGELGAWMERKFNSVAGQ